MRNLGILVSASLVAFALACTLGGTPRRQQRRHTHGWHSGGGTAGTTPPAATAAAPAHDTMAAAAAVQAHHTHRRWKRLCHVQSAKLSQLLATDCAESGTCTTQTDLSTESYNTCYTNGVKEIVVHDVLTDNRTMTVKKNGATCFSTEFNGMTCTQSWVSSR